MDDFVTVLKPKSMNCPEGHAKPHGSRAKYCPECGGKFDYWPLLVLSDMGKKLLEAFDLGDFPTSGDEDEVNEWWNWIQDGKPFVKVGVDRDTLIMGVDLADSGSIRGDLTTETLTREEIRDAWDKVTEWRAEMGYGDSKVLLYVWLYVSS
jgi:hypothetical protein